MSGSLLEIWAGVTSFEDAIVALALTLGAAIVFRLLRPSVKIIWGRSNNSIHYVGKNTEQEIEIYAEKFFIQNTGRNVANNLEFVMSAAPADLSVWQPRDWKISEIAQGDVLISIPTISPGELVMIDCVYLNQRAANIRSVRCDECLGKLVAFETVRSFSWRVKALAASLMFLGAAFVVLAVLKLAQAFLG